MSHPYSRGATDQQGSTLKHSKSGTADPRDIAAEATRLVAAVTLANEAFPRESDLPRLARVPYNNLGHLVLLDYHKLATILWGTVHEIQESYRKDPRRIVAPLLGLVIAALGIVLGLAMTSGVKSPEGPAVPAIIPVVLGIVVGLAAHGAARVKLEQVAAEVRARNMLLLLKGQEPPSAAEFSKVQLAHRRLVDWGDGDLGNGRCPVLVMTQDEQPFPGYGRRQANQLFICRPAEEKSPPALSSETLRATVADALIRMTNCSGLSWVSSGSVIVIDGRTLRKDSPWLSPEAEKHHRAPPLFVPENELATVSAVDERASVRVYTCIQAVVPEYLMCLTFFVRTFLAGNSAACEVNVSTLGPPYPNWDHIQARLRVFDREQGTAKRAEATRPSTSISSLGVRLQLVRYVLERQSVGFTSPLASSEVLKFVPFDDEAILHEKTQVDRIVANTEQWPGLFTGLVNWRESHSLTFTTDFFGNSESRAVLKTLYDRICRSALSQLKELGFDISDYQDETGKFSINADSIEHLVVGERVYMEPKSTKAAESSEATPRNAEATK